MRSQLKQLQDDLRRVDRNLSKSQTDKEVLMGKIGEYTSGTAVSASMSGIVSGDICKLFSQQMS